METLTSNQQLTLDELRLYRNADAFEKFLIESESHSAYIVGCVREMMFQAYSYSPIFAVIPNMGYVFKRVVGGYAWVRYDLTDIQTDKKGVEIGKQQYERMKKLFPNYYNKI